MDEFGLDFSENYSTKINSIKTHFEDDISEVNHSSSNNSKSDTFDYKKNVLSNEPVFLCNSNKCKKHALDKTKELEKPSKYKFTPSIKKKKKKKKCKVNNYYFLYLLIIFILCNNYSLFIFLSRYKMTYYTSLSIRLLFFAIFSYYGEKYFI